MGWIGKQDCVRCGVGEVEVVSVMGTQSITRRLDALCSIYYTFLSNFCQTKPAKCVCAIKSQ